MKKDLNRVFKNILCLTIAILISLMQLQFFENTEIFSLVFLVILLVTVPTVYMYFLPRHETIIIFVYNIVLVYLLDVSGKDVNIKLFLATLFCIVLLYTQSIFTTNVERTKAKKPSYMAYYIILISILIVVSSLSLYIYENVLKPNTDESNQLLLFQDKNDYEDEELEEETIDNNEDDNSGGGGGGSEIEDPIDVKLLVKNLLIGISITILAYILYKIIRYRLWLNKVLKSSNENQILEFYNYILNTLEIIGLGKKEYETPYEFNLITENDKFFLDKNNFRSITNSFVKVKYGDKKISDLELEYGKKLFYSISKEIKKELGMKFYMLKYLPKKRV